MRRFNFLKREPGDFAFSIVAIALFGTSSLAFGGGIQGTAHDFSPLAWSKGALCETCHTPHHADTSQPTVPLWNHSTTQQVFIPYQSNTLKASVGQPDGVSKLCLSCHDGTIAVDSFGGYAGTNIVANPIGPNLNSSQGHWGHPISFVYDSNLASVDGSLNDPNTARTALGGTINADLLSSGQLQCTSCHDVHNKYGNPTLMKITETNDTLCATCHNNM